MTRDQLLAHCLAKPKAWTDTPFGDDRAKTRDEADEWLRQYPVDGSVMAFLGRSGWNTLAIGGAIPDEGILGGTDV